MRRCSRSPLGATLGNERLVFNLEIAVERYRARNAVAVARTLENREKSHERFAKDAGTIQTLLDRLNTQPAAARAGR